MLSNFSNLESYFLLAVFAFKSKVSIQVILKMIQWRFCAANQQVLILKFASRSEKFPGFLRNRPLEKYPGYQRFFSRAVGIFGVGRRPTHKSLWHPGYLRSIMPQLAICWINFHPVRVCHNLEVLVTVFMTILWWPIIIIEKLTGNACFI